MHRTRIAMTALLIAIALLSAACNGDSAELADTGAAPATVRQRPPSAW